MIRAPAATALVLAGFVACSSFSGTPGDAPTADAATPDATTTDAADVVFDAASTVTCTDPTAIVCETFDEPLDSSLWKTHLNAKDNFKPEPPPIEVEGQLHSELAANGQNDGEQIDLHIPTNAPIRVSYDVQIDPVDLTGGVNFLVSSLSVNADDDAGDNGEFLGLYAQATPDKQQLEVYLTVSSTKAQLGNAIVGNGPFHVEVQVTWGASGTAAFFVNGQRMVDVKTDAGSESMNTSTTNPVLALGAGRPNGETSHLLIRYDNLLVRHLQ